MAICAAATYVNPLSKREGDPDRQHALRGWASLSTAFPPSHNTTTTDALLDRRFVTWLQGWITWFSWIALLAGITNIAANVTTVIVGASYPDYVAQGWHTILIMYAFLIALGLLNMYGFWLIPWIELLAGLLHIVLWLVYAVVLLTWHPGIPHILCSWRKRMRPAGLVTLSRSTLGSS